MAGNLKALSSRTEHKIYRTYVPKKNLIARPYQNINISIHESVHLHPVPDPFEKFAVLEKKKNLDSLLGEIFKIILQWAPLLRTLTQSLSKTFMAFLQPFVLRPRN
jgi:hypothetical protein